MRSTDLDKEDMPQAAGSYLNFRQPINIEKVLRYRRIVAQFFMLNLGLQLITGIKALVISLMVMIVYNLADGSLCPPKYL
jgi:hypothetical protein